MTYWVRFCIHVFVVTLGNIRVFCRVRPLIKEDGGGQMAENIVSLDQDDSGVLYINSKGRTQVFEVDRVFGDISTQQQVEKFLLGNPLSK